ncbi:class I SAM-dependent methyltransferase [Desulfatitalea alkaliphila]|uniref:Methyltransferase domain-containing protein n=1 Tax=Desulfatitalea alkaliphila TaxID=2929485 RepID=A0AA41R262_9BACT|nr:class I SAM-dependent methyltransferase [Desulfatitalea alkaliphila]MCJ8500664.1 methyltransferase domain-containing protein [Desulfatitalea alkaliphila]
MIQAPPYLMENEAEIERLEMKTDVAVVQQQAVWAGIAPGMRVADIGCGAGVTTRALFDLVQPGGTVVGLDVSAERIAHAQNTYGAEGLTFECCNVLEPLCHLAPFDFVWVRFFLEYHGRRAFDIVARLAECLKPGGILCLIDLDHNCLNHYAMPDHLSAALHGIMQKLAEEADFDPRIGIKLYSFLYDLGFEAIDVALAAHHLIHGPLNEVDRFNWTKKLEVAVGRSGYPFECYPGGYEGFVADFQNFFAQPRRFTYTPLIACRGRKPCGDLSAG